MRPPAALALLALLAGCTAAPQAPAAEQGRPAGTLTVFAAASLTDVFTELGNRLADDHPGLAVRFSFAGSSALAAQIGQGAPADVFAAADEEQMDRVGDLVGEVAVFASNRLVLALAPENPAGIERPDSAGVPGLGDLVDADATLAVCAPEVPCGAAAAGVLERAGLADAPDTYEDDVRAVLTKVQLGEVDAGLVYRTDVLGPGDVVGLAFAEAEAARNSYPVAVLADAPNPAAARAFVELLRSGEGQRLLADAGFSQP